MHTAIDPTSRPFALGVRIDEVALAARKGGNAVLVWLAVRAREGGAGGAPATVGWIVEATGLNGRTVRWAIAALVRLGLLRRDGRKISSRERPR
jgi:hypothetical protein